MTQLAMAKANRASLLWPALRLSRCKSMSPYEFDGDVVSGVLRHRCHRCRRRTGALQPQEISKDVPFGADVGGSAVDRFQEHQ
jgi:hypothetical protein